MVWSNLEPKKSLLVGGDWWVGDRAWPEPELDTKIVNKSVLENSINRNVDVDSVSQILTFFKAKQSLIQPQWLDIHSRIIVEISIIESRGLHKEVSRPPWPWPVHNQTLT